MPPKLIGNVKECFCPYVKEKILMDSTTIPLTHIQTGLTIIGLFITAGAMAFGAAWAGVKLALAPLRLEISLNKEAYRAEISEIRKDRDKRGLFLEQLQKAIEHRALKSDCVIVQTSCGRFYSSRIDMLSKQVDEMAIDVKENTRLLGSLTVTFEERTKHFEALENLINERSNNFRPPTAKDLMT